MQGDAAKMVLTDQEYFTSYEDLEIHRLMIQDGPRMTAYGSAIAQNPHLFLGKTVMDVGSGTGVLSLMAARAGAKRVHAVEASNTAGLIEKVAAANGYADIITVHKCRVEDLDLPGVTVDVMISEWMGFYLLHESMLNSVLIARDRFLSAGGAMFPSEARLYCCPTALPALYREQVDFWDSVAGFDMSAIGDAVVTGKTRKPEVCRVKEEDLLAKPVCFKVFNLRWMAEADLSHFSEDVFVDIAKDGRYDGVCVWFECDFDGKDYDEEGAEFGELVTLATGPLAPPTHWKQTVIVFGARGGDLSGDSDDSVTSIAEKSSKTSDKNDVSDDHLNSIGSTNGCYRNSSDRINLVSPEDNSLTGNSCKRLKTELNNFESVKCTLPKIKDSIKSPNSETKISPENQESLMDSNSETPPKLPPFINVERDEVIGFRLQFSQSEDNVRHYCICLEMLDAECDPHPEGCGCSMPRCLIIAKLLEQELET